MNIFSFLITDIEGNLTLSNVYCRNRIEAMYHLSLILGCEDMAIDYLRNLKTSEPLEWDNFITT